MCPCNVAIPVMLLLLSERIFCPKEVRLYLTISWLPPKEDHLKCSLSWVSMQFLIFNTGIQMRHIHCRLFALGATNVAKASQERGH